LTNTTTTFIVIAQGGGRLGYTTGKTISHLQEVFHSSAELQIFL